MAEPAARIGALRALALLALAGAVLLAVLAAVAWVAASRTPAWWARAGATGPGSEERAAALERGAAAFIHAEDGPAAPTAVEVRQEDLNAWLRHRLPRWIENRGASMAPAEEARLRLEPGRVRLGVMVRGRLIEAEFAPSIVPGPRGESAVMLHALKVRAGALRLALGRDQDGAATLAGLLARALGMDEAGAARLAGALRAEHPAVEDALLRLEDGRTIRLTGLEVHEGRLVMETRRAR